MPEPTYRLPSWRRAGYGVGHVLNDLCASIWFSYFLLYFHSVLNFSNQNAGYLMLIGQIADAICTPLVGYESDRTAGFFRYTKRKSWHLIGTICVACTFPFIFMVCLGCSHSQSWAQFLYYAPFIAIFQFGWASTQISHLSLIPELTPNGSERVELNAIRYALTVCSNIAVYVMAWLLLNQDKGSAELGPEDASKFRILVLMAVGIGLSFSLFFHLLTQERHEVDRPRGLYSTLSLHQKMQWKDWLKEHQFYMIAFLYMCTRLVVNVSQIYLPMYVIDSLKLNKVFIATVPLSVFVSGFLTAFIMRPLNNLAGRKVTYLMGICLVLAACVWMFFIRQSSALEVFGAGILIGAGGSTILVTSLSLTADLIGDRTESGAFVYGAMSFTDKLSNGVAIVLIQHMHPCKTSACCPACTWYYRDMMVFVVGGVAILALVCLILLVPQKIGRLRKCLGMPDDEDETKSLMTPRSDPELTSSSDDCCSYLCCVNSSREAQVHQAVVCGACGQVSCGTLCANTATDGRSAPHMYESIDSLVRAAAQQNPGTSNQGHPSPEPVSSNGKLLAERELKNCIDCKDTAANGETLSQLADETDRSRVKLKVDVDVHAKN